MTVELSADLEARLKAAAAARGQSPGDYLRAELERILPPTGSEDGAPENAEERRARVYAIAGKYAHLPFTVEDFLREKHEEARREAERDRQCAGEDL